MVIKQFIATKALILFNNKILLLKESSKYVDGSNQGKFDVVGGRIEPEQNFKESLLREINEEAGLKVEIKEPFFVKEWYPKINNEKCQVIGIYFICDANSDKVILSEDHESFVWIDPNDYKKYNLISDLKLVFEEYLKNNK